MEQIEAYPITYGILGLLAMVGDNDDAPYEPPYDIT